MNLLIKYYDTDLGGGGIPDEVKKAWDENVSCTCDEAYKIRGLIAPDCAHCNYDHVPEIIYSLASEEIYRLKAENERSRGIIKTLHDRNLVTKQDKEGLWARFAKDNNL